MSKRKAPPSAGSRPAALGRSSFGRRRSALPFLAVIVVVVVALFAIVPGLRHHVTSDAHHVRRDVDPHYAQIPLATAASASPNGCTDPSIGSNSTVYWYTQAVGATPQVLTVTFASSFTGDLDKIGVTPIAPSSTPAGSGENALPAPSQLQLSGAGPVTPDVVDLADPPKFQSFTVKAHAPRSLQIRLATADTSAPSTAPSTAAPSTAAPNTSAPNTSAATSASAPTGAANTCAETAFIFYQKD